MPPNITVMKKPKDTKGTLRRLIQYLAVYKYLLLAVLTLCLVSNILSLLGPSLAGSAINEAAAGAGKVNFTKVYYYAKWMLICYVSASVLTIVINEVMM